MRRMVLFLLGGLLLVPTAAWAATGRVECIAPHFVLHNGAELRWSILYFSNSDLINPTTITRLTFRNIFGDIVSDTGPDASPPSSHPPAPGPPGTTISPVLPGGASTLITPNIFGEFSIEEGANFKGIPLTVIVEYSKEGNAGRFFVRGTSVASKRIEDNGTFRRVGRLAHNFLPCFVLSEEVDDD